MSGRLVQTSRTLPDIVVCPLQAVRADEESLPRFTVTTSSMGQGSFCQNFFLPGDRQFPMNLSGSNSFVTEPQRAQSLRTDRVLSVFLIAQWPCKRTDMFCMRVFRRSVKN